MIFLALIMQAVLREAKKRQLKLVGNTLSRGGTLWKLVRRGENKIPGGTLIFVAKSRSPRGASVSTLPGRNDDVGGGGAWRGGRTS